MKNILTLYLFLSLSFQVQAQQNLTDEEKIKAVIIEMFQELANRNAEKMKEYCESDIQLLENGEIWTLDTLIQKIKINNTPDFKRVNSFEFLSVTIDNNSAWTTYNNKAEVTRNGEHFRIEWLETAILLKKKNNWRIKVLHSTLLKREKL